MGAQFLAMRLFDVTVHAWDLAKATSGDERIDDRLAACALRAITALDGGPIWHHRHRYNHRHRPAPRQAARLQRTWRVAAATPFGLHGAWACLLRSALSAPPSRRCLRSCGVTVGTSCVAVGWFGLPSRRCRRDSALAVDNGLFAPEDRGEFDEMLSGYLTVRSSSTRGSSSTMPARSSAQRSTP
jgi:hypothetical protein